jgi:Glycosyltransferase like family
MILCTITTDPSVHPERFESFGSDASGIAHFRRWENVPNIGLVPAMQQCYEEYTGEFPDEDILCYVHDDVTCYEPYWDKRVLAEFDDPKVAIVGFGGATGIGTSEIYKTRYDITQLQRIDYTSNARDWQTHGSRETGSKDVAVIDGYFMAVRRSFLKEIGGWKWFPYRFHCYDTSLCLMAHRRGYKVRMVGVECQHWGGSFSASPDYEKWCRENGTTMEREHTEPHRWMYDVFRPELPLRV